MEKPLSPHSTSGPDAQASSSGTPPPCFDMLAARSGLPRAEARRLLAKVSGRPLTWFMAHGDETPAADMAAAFDALAARRRAGEPLAYLLGEQEFYGRVFGVSPAVLIPRADTETLGAVALAKCKAAPEKPAPDTPGAPTSTPPVAIHTRRAPSSPGPTLLELGTGSGIIAITLALETPEFSVHAIERSPNALAVAQQNARALGAENIQWHLGSWWDALPPTAPRFDLIVSNPPYIARDDHHLQQGDLRFEPPQALAAGSDGLDDLRILAGGAPHWLKPGGWLLLEHGYDQGAAVRTLLEAAGFDAVFTCQDLGGNDRVSGGVLNI